MKLQKGDGARLAAGLERFEAPAAHAAPPGTVRCPDCRREVCRGEAQAKCSACGRSLVLLAERLLDTLGSGSPDAEQILAWPDEFADRVAAWLLAHQTGSPLPADVLFELRERGLVSGDGRPTALGARLTHYLQMREGQHGDEQFQSFVASMELGPEARVLDVGCSMGQTLGWLAAYRPAELVGVDVDLEALALGCRLGPPADCPIEFLHATAHALPFADRAFTQVICRNALTYMHHRHGLAEITRVLRPGGFLYLRVENVRFDLLCLCRPPAIRRFCCRLRDFHGGLLNALTGWQAPPGSRLGGGRSFATVRGLRAILGDLGCEVLRTEESIRCPRFLGGSTQTSLLVRKCR